MKNIYLILRLAFFLCIMMVPQFLLAQGTDPGCDPLDPNCPIDGGLSLLIAAGIGIAGKKAYDAKKREQRNAQHTNGI